MSGRGVVPSARSTARRTFTIRSTAARPSWIGPWASWASPCGTFWAAAADEQQAFYEFAGDRAAVLGTIEGDETWCEHEVHGR